MSSGYAYNYSDTRDGLGNRLYSYDWLYFNLFAELLSIPLDLEAEFTAEAQRGYGQFQSYRLLDGANDFERNVYAEAQLSSLTVSEVGVVPLPAGFPLLGAGLGLLGLMGWRKRRSDAGSAMAA